MINYLEKFNKLPPAIKQAISSEEIMASIAEIENKYDVNLATVVMRVAVKDIAVLDLSKYFMFEHEMDARRAEELVGDLKKNVLYVIADYLGFDSGRRVPSETETKIRSEIGGDIKKAASSNFFFSSEDEEEVSELAKKVDGYVSREDLMKQKEEFSRQMDEKLKIILNQLTIQFSSLDMTNRFKYVISSYLRGIRNRVDTREVLKKGIDNGGLELDDILVDRVLNVVDKVNKEDIKTRSEQKPPAKISVPEDEIAKNGQGGSAETMNKGSDKDISVNGAKRSDHSAEGQAELQNDLKLSGVRDVEYDFSKFSQKNGQKSENSETEKADAAKSEGGQEASQAEKASKENSEPIIDLSSREKLDSIIEEAGKKSKERQDEAKAGKPKLEDVLNDQNLDKQAGAERVMGEDKINIVNVRRPSEDSGRKRMEDVKYVPKLTGPLDELKEMTLVDFRRLSHDPNVSSRKIAEKISFLEEESYSKRLAGIKAWRQSPVNKLYLDIGQQSINEKAGVDEIINQRRDQGAEFLNSEEFAAIMDLNKELRF